MGQRGNLPVPDAVRQTFHSLRFRLFGITSQRLPPSHLQNAGLAHLHELVILYFPVPGVSIEWMLQSLDFRHTP